MRFSLASNTGKYVKNTILTQNSKATLGGTMKRKMPRPKRSRLLLSTTLSEKSERGMSEDALDRLLLGRDGSIESMGESGEASEDTPSLPQMKTLQDNRPREKLMEHMNPQSDASQFNNRSASKRKLSQRGYVGTYHH